MSAKQTLETFKMCLELYGAIECERWCKKIIDLYNLTIRFPHIRGDFIPYYVSLDAYKDAAQTAQQIYLSAGGGQKGASAVAAAATEKGLSPMPNTAADRHKYLVQQIDTLVQTFEDLLLILGTNRLIKAIKEFQAHAAKVGGPIYEVP